MLLSINHLYHSSAFLGVFFNVISYKIKFTLKIQWTVTWFLSHWNFQLEDIFIDVCVILPYTGNRQVCGSKWWQDFLHVCAYTKMHLSKNILWFGQKMQILNNYACIGLCLYHFLRIYRNDDTYIKLYNYVSESYITK